MLFVYASVMAFVSALLQSVMKALGWTLWLERSHWRMVLIVGL